MPSRRALPLGLLAALVLCRPCAALHTIGEIDHIGSVSQQQSSPHDGLQLASPYPDAHARQLQQATASQGGCSELTADFIRQYARENTVMVTVVDILVMKHFAISWIKNVMAAGIDYWVMGTVDDKANRFLTRRGVRRCFKAAVGKEFKHEPEKKYGWGSADWGAATWRKVHVVDRLVRMGFNVVLSDLDVAWFRDPHDYFVHKWNQYVVLLSTDNLRSENPVGDDGPDTWVDPHNVLNTGVFYVKACPDAERMMTEWLKQEKGHGQDQEGFNNVMRGKATSHPDWQHVPWCKIPSDQKRMLICMNETIATGALSPGVFMHSYTFFVVRLHKMLQVKPYEIHFVWGGKGWHGKRQRMREALMYHDPPSYYRQGAFLSVELDYLQEPPGYNQMKVTEDMVRFHLASMEHQLAQLYHAFALALALDRALILPPLRCYCAKNWYMTENCRILGEQATQFPFNCSLGDFIKPKLLVDGLAIGSKTLQIREHTFLDNPRTAESVKQPAALVLAAGNGAGTAVASQGAPRVFQVHSRVGEGELNSLVVAPAAAYKRLHVPRPWQVFKGFSQPLQAQFDAALQGIPTYWCCRSPDDQKKMNLTDRVSYTFDAQKALSIVSKTRLY